MIGDLIEIYGTGQVIYQPPAGKCVIFKKFHGATGPCPQYPFYITNGDFKCVLRCGLAASSDYGTNFDNGTMEGISKTEWKFYCTRNAYMTSNVNESFFFIQGLSFNEWTPT
jgi:hypothetical protein